MAQIEKSNHNSDPREAGRLQVLDVIRAAGTIARIDIAKETGFSPATVTVITSQLLESGLIEEITPEPAADAKPSTRRGRPRVSLRLRGAAHLLKEGGEMYFSDVYADRRVPKAMAEDEVLYGECLSGALYWNDFLTIAKQSGFGDPRMVNTRQLTVDNPVLEARVAPLTFSSTTYRLFKLPALESACEDYGQAVIYKGTLEHAPHAFELDSHHKIETGKVFPVCGNTWMMLKDTRFAEHFEFIGNFDTHYGLFPGCGGDTPFAFEATGTETAGCC